MAYSCIASTPVWPAALLVGRSGAATSTRAGVGSARGFLNCRLADGPNKLSPKSAPAAPPSQGTPPPNADFAAAAAADRGGLKGARASGPRSEPSTAAAKTKASSSSSAGGALLASAAAGAKPLVVEVRTLLAAVAALAKPAIDAARPLLATVAALAKPPLAVAKPLPSAGTSALPPGASSNRGALGATALTAGFSTTAHADAAASSPLLWAPGASGACAVAEAAAEAASTSSTSVTHGKPACASPAWQLSPSDANTKLPSESHDCGAASATWGAAVASAWSRHGGVRDSAAASAPPAAFEPAFLDVTSPSLLSTDAGPRPGGTSPGQGAAAVVPHAPAGAKPLSSMAEANGPRGEISGGRGTAAVVAHVPAAA
mmetsp:Transcript_95332/g.269520  ORF Transcript_95332/g.269520 Transcript_95332/m.269520 type:complete len:374 (-) Transcript_95332:33-1154(-)